MELLSLFFDEWVLQMPPALRVLMAPSLFPAHLPACSQDPFTPLWLFREQTGTREVPDLTTAQDFVHLPPLEPAPIHPGFVQSVLHVPGAISEVTDTILMQKFLTEYKSAAVITPMRSWYTALAIYFGKAVCLFTQDCCLFFLSALSICFPGLFYSPYFPQWTPLNSLYQMQAYLYSNPFQ